MKLSIRMKIFLPVMALLFIFPMAVWLVFRYALDAHMNYNARRNLEWAVGRVEDIVGSNEDLLREFGEELAGEHVETRMMAIGDGYRLLYPTDFSTYPELTELYTLFLTKSTGAEESWKSGETMEDTVGNAKYLFYYRDLSEQADGQVNHVILYSPLYDTSGIMSQVSHFVLMVVFATAAVSIVLFWFVAGSISGPVIRLCEAARGIGEKKFKKVETGATVKELCHLEDEINNMQEKLAQADQAERTFFQNASHELRTPLMSISGYAQGIQCGIFEDVSQAAGVIMDESTRLTEVVDGILTLTRMDQSRYQLVPVEVDIHAFAEERLELLEGFAYSQKKKLAFETEDTRTMILDAMLLERAFSNVVSNCIRYARETVKVVIELQEEWAVIRIADDGPGIAADEVEHIFDRFYKGKNGNHGLGLAIAKRSLEYMGGTVRAESSESGAVFILTLPNDCRSFAQENWKEL